MTDVIFHICQDDGGSASSSRPFKEELEDPPLVTVFVQPKAKVKAKAPVQLPAVKQEEKVDKTWMKPEDSDAETLRVWQAQALQHQVDKEYLRQQFHQSSVAAEATILNLQEQMQRQVQVQGQYEQEVTRLQQVLQLQQQQQQQEALQQQQQQQQLQQQQQYQLQQFQLQQQHLQQQQLNHPQNNHAGQNWGDIDPNGRQVPPFWTHGPDTRLYQ